MIARRAALATLAATGALAIMGASGCQSTGGGGGSKTFEGEQNRVDNVIAKLYDAYQDEAKDRGNGARTACDEVLSARLKGLLDRRGGCERVTKAALKDADDADPNVRDIRITGDRAVARVLVRVSNDKERNDQLTFVREGRNRTWHLDGSTPGKVTKR